MRGESCIFGIEKIQARYLDHQCHVFISLNFTFHPKVKLQHKNLPSYSGLEGPAVVLLKGWYHISLMKELVDRSSGNVC